jgi:hypothetical protein
MDHKEYPLESEIAVDYCDKIDRTASVEVENYHGLSAKIVVVYFVRCRQALHCMRELTFLSPFFSSPLHKS